MKFPRTNKIHRTFKEEFGENAKLLEEHLTQLNWRVWLRAWGVGLVLLCITLFAVVFSVNFALWIL